MRGGRPERSGRADGGSRRSLSAALLSVLVHALLVAVLFSLRGERRLPERPAPLQVELRETLRTPPPKPAPVPPVKPVVKGAAKVRRVAKGGGKAKAPPGVANPGGGGRGGGSAGAAAPWSPEWMEQEGLEYGQSPERAAGGRGPFVPGEIREGFAAGIGPEQRGPPGTPDDPAAEVARVQGRVQAFITDLKAYERAEFMPDAYWSGLRERLAKDFKPDWDIQDKGGGGEPSWVPRSTRDLIGGYGDMASRYARTGNPFDNAPGSPGSKRSLQDDVRDPFFQMPGLSEHSIDPGTRLQFAMATPGGTPFRHTLVAVVSITQDDDGKVVAVSLAGSSGNSAYDRMAMDKAESMTSGDSEEDELGPPPEKLRKTLWAFETDFSQIPPVPVVGCSFDAYFIPQDCFWPGKKFIKPRVKLRAIY